MPLLFISSALFPLRFMPQWLVAAATFNSLTYAIDLIRFFISPSYTTTGLNILADIAVVLTFATITISISTWTFTREVKKAL